MKHKEKCPEKEVLKQFVGTKLADDMNENIFSHLKSCDKCRDLVKFLLSEERELLQSLFDKPVFHKDKSFFPSKKCIPKIVILAYACECLNENQLKLVESHLDKCDNCLNNLMELQRSLALPEEVELNIASLIAADKRAERSDIDILEIVLKLKDNLLELVSSTGKHLRLSPEFGAVRGSQTGTEETIAIRKDYKHKDLSLEVTINREIKENRNNLKVSIMKLSSEEFLPDIEVILSGKDIRKQVKTDNSGTAEFHCISKGSYDIHIMDKKISSITIR